MIRRYTLLVLLIPLLSIAQTSPGEAPPPPVILGEPVPSPPPPPPAETVPLEDWIAGMKTQMPDYICQDQGAWLECFGMEPESCHGTATELSALCLDILAENMPANLSQQEVGRWGVEAARCFNLTFFNLHQDALSEREECQAPPAHLR